MKVLTAEEFIKLSRHKREQIRDYVHQYIGIQMSDIREFGIPTIYDSVTAIRVVVYLKDSEGRRYQDPVTQDAAKAVHMVQVPQPFPEY